MQKNICKRCYLANEEKNYINNLSAYIEQIADDIKTNPPIYAERLAICRSCEKQQNGLCLLCGCFVEIRAAVKTHYCPMAKRKW